MGAQMETLILTAAWEPVGGVGWERAMTLWLAGRAEVVEVYEDRRVRTVSVHFEVPSVLRFVRGLRPQTKRRPSFSRANVYARDEGRCQYCGRRVPRHDATFDHVVPRGRGGKTGWDNIVIACLPCNRVKACRTPDEAGMALLAAPRRPHVLPRAPMMVTWEKGMPLTWRQYLRDTRYWGARLEQDG